MPDRTHASAPPPVPPNPQDRTSSSVHRPQQAADPTVDPTHRRTTSLPLILGIIAGSVLLIFAAVQYGDSIMTLLKPDQGMPQDFDVEPPTVADSEPAADTLSRPELSSESISVQKSEDNTDGDMYLYNLQDYETFEPATLADFEWVTYDIAHGILPTGINAWKVSRRLKADGNCISSTNQTGKQHHDGASVPLQLCRG